MSKAKLLPQIIASLTVCIGSYAFGSAVGWTSNITQELKNGSLNGIFMNNTELAWTASIFTLGAMVSCFCLGFLADAIGRKFACLLTVLPLTCGWLLILLAVNVKVVYLGRFLVGVGGGGFNIMAPLYTTEIAQLHIRGSLGIMMQALFELGVLHSNVLGWALPLFYFNLVCMAIPILFAIVFSFQPETPIYYLKKNKLEKAEKSFRKLRGKDYDFSVEVRYFELEMREGPSTLNLKNFFKMMFTMAQIKATIICFMLMFFQQFSGRNVVVFYTLEIFVHSKTQILPHMYVIITGVVGFFGSVLTVWLIDKLGRNLLLQVSSFLCAVSTFLLGLYFTIKTKLEEEDINKVAHFLPLLALLLFIFGFNIGLGPIPWLTCSEIWPASVKAKLSSVVGTCNWLLAFLITRFYLSISLRIGIDNIFYIFMSSSILSIYFITAIVPETKGKRYVDLVLDLQDFFN